MTDVRLGDRVRVIYEGIARDKDLTMVWLEGHGWVATYNARIEVVERPKPKFHAGDKLTRVAQLDDLPNGSVVVREHLRGERPHFMPVYKDIGTGSWLIPGDRKAYSSSEIHVLPAVVLRIPE